MNKYKTSTGEKVTQTSIEARTRNAKRLKVQSMDFIHCEKCGISTGTYFDCSHIIGVKEAKESGRTELCYDMNNIELLCRKCHNEIERMSKQERQNRYEEKNS